MSEYSVYRVRLHFEGELTRFIIQSDLIVMRLLAYVLPRGGQVYVRPLNGTKTPFGVEQGHTPWGADKQLNRSPEEVARVIKILRDAESNSKLEKN
jgi:hypothetical protein